MEGTGFHDKNKTDPRGVPKTNRSAPPALGDAAIYLERLNRRRENQGTKEQVDAGCLMEGSGLPLKGSGAFVLEKAGVSTRGRFLVTSFQPSFCSKTDRQFSRV